MQEVDNAITMAMKEIANRFDFKGSVSRIEKEGENLKIVAEDDYKLRSVKEIFEGKLVKRQVPLKFFEYGQTEDSLGGQKKVPVKILKGLPQEKAKEITKLIKNSGLKVQAQIQGDQIRVSAKKIDDLQAVMQQIKAANLPIALSFQNYR